MRIPEISYVASVRLEPLGALSVMQIDLGLAPPIIDLLLGGEGKEGPLRELTDIEESILASVVEIICRELTAAWQPVGLSFNFERRQMQTQVARIMSVNEKTLCLSFEIRMPHGSGLTEPGVSGSRSEYDSSSSHFRLGSKASSCARDARSHGSRSSTDSFWGCTSTACTCEYRRMRLENLERERFFVSTSRPTRMLNGGLEGSISWMLKRFGRELTGPRGSAPPQREGLREEFFGLLDFGRINALLPSIGRRVGTHRVIAQSSGGASFGFVAEVTGDAGGRFYRRRSIRRFLMFRCWGRASIKGRLGRIAARSGGLCSE